MARRHAIISDENNLRIPEDANTYDGFLRWSESGEFPETGRIDYLAGKIEVDTSPEDLYTHSAVKTAVALTLINLVSESERGEVFIDRTQVRSRFAQLAAEPDFVIVLDTSSDAGQVRRATSKRYPDRIVALEGAPDIVIEIVSHSSVKKDYERLPPLYARAGIPELWIIDARSEDLLFSLHTLRDGNYEPVSPDSEGWLPSPRLGQVFRLLRWKRPNSGMWKYKLEVRDDFSGRAPQLA